MMHEDNSLLYKFQTAASKSIKNSSLIPKRMTKIEALARMTKNVAKSDGS